MTRTRGNDPARPPQVRRQPVSYLVTLWPEGHECHDVTLFSLLVRYRGDGKWSVEQGWTSGDMKPVLGADGRWHVDERGNPRLRFPLDEALQLAEEHAADVTINGITTPQALARHQERGCPDR